MLVEKKTWKNLIKPVLKYLGYYLLIFFILFILFIFFKLAPLSDDFGIRDIAVTAVSALFVWLVFVLELCNLKKDFHQIVKVDDLSTLNNDELLDYEFELCETDDEDDEYHRVKNEIDKRHIGNKYKSENEHITIEIQNDRKKYFSDIMKYINDSNVIPSRIKESLKEDILKTYSKHQPSGERFITSKENAAVFNAAFNEVTTVNQGFGDYGFIYEYENWKWQYGTEKK